MIKKKITSNRPILPTRILQYIRHVSLLHYYRYTVEVGISILQGWESFIVNSIVLLLVVSLVKQLVKCFVFLLRLYPFFSYIF
ncbi:hypothetical protein NEFER03_0355 [Nematocida sp. LUAm3]|nr:hypothetical protein NEFER03_0355 [Nematocida sp. LUAm3]KAI5175457.1 hypothetical protein NEFER02_1363 [Nematocida sp. LUAm2]KAI5178376.1 hypothetical protein NEFER01_1523 [Nematocida sp. LUAm1]